MKKFISLCFATFLVCSISFAQETSSTTEETTAKKANCLPAKECAEKMGMTVAEYKEYCQKKCSTKSETQAAMGNSAMATFASIQAKGAEGTENAVAANTAECAAILGISLEECMARITANCGGMGMAKNATSSELASALMVSEKAATKSAKATCKKAATACASKKIN